MNNETLGYKVKEGDCLEERNSMNECNGALHVMEEGEREWLERGRQRKTDNRDAIVLV